MKRENTFTKDSTDHSVSQSTTEAVSVAAKSQSANVYQSRSDDVRLVRGKLVKASEQEDRSYTVSDLRASFRKPSDNLALEGDIDYQKKGSEWVPPSSAFKGNKCAVYILHTQLAPVFPIIFHFSFPSPAGTKSCE